MVEDRDAASCRNCAGCGWVCENHTDTPWAGLVEGDECCGGAGSPCPVCQPLMACSGYAQQVAATERARMIARMREPDAKMVEAVAKAIWERSDDEVGWGASNRDPKMFEATKWALGDARAALAAAADAMEVGDAG